MGFLFPINSISSTGFIVYDYKSLKDSLPLSWGTAEAVRNLEGVFKTFHFASSEATKQSHRYHIIHKMLRIKLHNNTTKVLSYFVNQIHFTNSYYINRILDFCSLITIFNITLDHLKLFSIEAYNNTTKVSGCDNI